MVLLFMVYQYTFRTLEMLTIFNNLIFANVIKYFKEISLPVNFTHAHYNLIDYQINTP